MGRARGRKLTVEESLCLDSTELRRAGVFSSGYGTSFTCRWHRSGGRPDCTIKGRLVEMPGVAMALQMAYEICDPRSLAKLPLEYLIKVTSTRCQFGGRRLWFRCPLLRDGVACERRVRRLYLCPSAQAFG